MANRRAMARLHEVLLRVARGEAGRRRTISPTVIRSSGFASALCSALASLCTMPGGSPRMDGPCH